MIFFLLPWLSPCLSFIADPNQPYTEGFGKGVCNRFVKNVLSFSFLFLIACLCSFTALWIMGLSLWGRVCIFFFVCVYVYIYVSIYINYYYVWVDYRDFANMGILVSIFIQRRRCRIWILKECQVKSNWSILFYFFFVCLANNIGISCLILKRE